MMLTNLPNDILILIFSKYLSLEDLFSISQCSKYFKDIIFNYVIKNINNYPVLDLNYPFGYNQYDEYSKSYSVDFNNFYRLKCYLNLKNNPVVQKKIYAFSEKMFPSIQIGEDTRDSHGFRSVYLTDDNQFLWLNLDDVIKSNPIEISDKYYRKKKFVNKIKTVNRVPIIGYGDIRKFKKKDDFLVCSFDKGLKLFLYENDRFEMINELAEQNNRINCVDLGLKYKKIIYGCTNGLLKIGSTDDFSFSQINVKDRIIRCCFSPSEKDLAVGTAGIYPHKNSIPSPVRIYDLFSFKEKQHLVSPGGIKIGGGILSLSFIDENTVMSAGYDTFIRIFDLRSNKCIQSLEEPEDMSIYSVCCSKYYGLLSGNDRQSIVRYWDRRVNRIIRSFEVCKTNSSVYSLACTPDCILAGVDLGIILLDFRYS
ncbi:F-box WD repeat-containing 4 [Brachionus plicatilis]|uniref:F-box WD repeat-containing 4 n=1 Tax=Brachionus plicatilis TaxID=10195 RepID=A0A3M7SZF8_BRAPC|nr:F-box WD repeat-containing 4 [Brachionus plicatilis]